MISSRGMVKVALMNISYDFTTMVMSAYIWVQLESGVARFSCSRVSPETAFVGVGYRQDGFCQMSGVEFPQGRFSLESVFTYSEC